MVHIPEHVCCRLKRREMYKHQFKQIESHNKQSLTETYPANSEPMFKESGYLVSICVTCNLLDRAEDVLLVSSISSYLQLSMNFRNETHNTNSNYS